jgi:hypothetical protein
MLGVAGLSLAVAATVFYVVVVALQAVVVGRFDGDPLRQGAADAILDAFLGAAPWWALVLGGTGILVAAVCWLLGRVRHSPGEKPADEDGVAVEGGPSARRRCALVGGLAAAGLLDISDKHAAEQAFEISESARARSLVEFLRSTETNLLVRLDPELAKQIAEVVWSELQISI